MKIMSFWLAKAHQLEIATDITSFLSSLFPRSACRKTESAGNGVLSSGEKNFSVHKTYMNFSRPRKRAPEAALYDLRGRSMVEMLGVLAIIGVLSVGAISGYQKAMFKYKLNIQAQQISTLINAVNTYYNDLKFTSQTNLIPYLKVLNVIPLEMIDKSNPSSLYDVFHTRIALTTLPSGSSSNFSTRILIYSSLKTKASENLEICHNIFLAAKESQAGFLWVSTSSGYGTEDSLSLRLYGNENCTDKVKCLKDLTMNDIYSMCTSHVNKLGAYIEILWTYTVS